MFQDSQGFFVSYMANGIWCFTETEALKLFFLDARGKLRGYAPPEDWVVATLEARLLDGDSPKTGKNRAHAAARRALTEGLEKLHDRARRVAIEGIQPSNSLALTGLDTVVLDLLNMAGFKTRRSVSLAPDEQLLRLKGLNRRRLSQIRHFCPRVSQIADRRLARANAGQLSLF